MSDGSSTRVLVVDNDVSLGEAIKYILEVLDLQVTTSSRAIEALELLKKGLFGVVIVDLSLGGMNNGSQLLEALRIHGNHTPALVFAPAGSSPEAATMKKLGVVGVLSKPMDPSAVKRIVMQVLRPHAASPIPAAPPPVAAASLAAPMATAKAPAPAAAPRPPAPVPPRAPGSAPAPPLRPRGPAVSAAPQRPASLVVPQRSAPPAAPSIARPPPKPPAAGPDFYLPPDLVPQPIAPQISLSHAPQHAPQPSLAPHMRNPNMPATRAPQPTNIFPSAEPPAMYISAAAPAPTPSTSPDNGGVREFQITTQTPFNEIRVDSFAPSQGSLAPAHAASQASVAAMRPPMPTILSTGSPMTLGRYIVQNTIASGGMGIVYRALDPHLERPVAVKVLKPTQGDQKQVEFFASFVARFRREAVALAKLRHPNIVAVYDYGLDEPTGMAYVVMELVEGESLGAVIERNQKLPYALAMSIIVQMAEALAAAHDLGIVHRDIKPENVILEKGNRVRLIDFGMARMAESTGKSAEHLLGSPNYLSPELAEAKAVDWRSDQFSLATVLLEMLSGRRVFRGDRILQTVNNVSTRATPSFRDLGIQGTPRELEALVMRMHQKFPSRRVQDERELVGDLRAMAAMVS